MLKLSSFVKLAKEVNKVWPPQQEAIIRMTCENKSIKMWESCGGKKVITGIRCSGGKDHLFVFSSKCFYLNILLFISYRGHLCSIFIQTLVKDRLHGYELFEQGAFNKIQQKKIAAETARVTHSSPSGVNNLQYVQHSKICRRHWTLAVISCCAL